MKRNKLDFCSVFIDSVIDEVMKKIYINFLGLFMECYEIEPKFTRNSLMFNLILVKEKKKMCRKIKINV
jgi:hypothetical protein